MFEHFLHRDEAPFKKEAWEAIDHAVVGAAKSQLTARRLLHTEGPYGLGIKSIPLADKPLDEKPAIEGVTVLASAMLPLAMLRREFALPARDIAAFEQTGLPLDPGLPADAAIAIAREEDALLFNGSKGMKADGILSARGSHSMKLKSWEKIGAAAEDVIQAVTALDDAGFHGPYTLGLSPQLHNLLYRRYPNAEATVLEHVRTILGEGVVKSQAIAAGGVLLASGREFATIVVGQDLATGFVGPEPGAYRFVVYETLALRLIRPDAFVVLKAG